jgi:hypothetical protein
MIAEIPVQMLKNLERSMEQQFQSIKIDFQNDMKSLERSVKSEMEKSLERSVKSEMENVRNEVQNDMKRVSFDVQELRDNVQTLSLIADNEAKTIPISGVSSGVFTRALANLKLLLSEIDAEWRNLPSEAEDTSDQSFCFEWTRDKEDNPRNRAKYMEYLGTFPWPDGYRIVDVVSQKNLLKTSFGGFSFGGTIDVVLTTTDGATDDALSGKVFLGIELKKPSNSATDLTYQKQVIIQHLSASYLFPDTKVLTLLTDLNDLWCFFWLDQSGCICKRNTNVTLSKFLVKNMFDPDVESLCPVGFQSRLSWNDFIQAHDGNVWDRIPVGDGEDRDDGNSSASADGTLSSKDDDGDINSSDVQGESKDENRGITNAVDIGKTAKRAACRGEWNDNPFSGYSEDLLALLDKQEFSELIFKASIYAIDPSCFTSTGTKNEDQDNSSTLRLTSMNLMRHNAMLSGRQKRWRREVIPVVSPLRLADMDFYSSSSRKKLPCSTHTTPASTPDSKPEAVAADSRSVADIELERTVGARVGDSMALESLIPPSAAAPELHPAPRSEPWVLSESVERDRPVNITKGMLTGQCNADGPVDKCSP